MTDKIQEETTYYRFMSEIRAFLSKLLKSPIKAEPSKYLKDRDFTRKKLIRELMSRSILERHEKILDSTNSDEKEPKYTVMFKVRKKDFESRIHKMYIKYFEKNEPEKEINEAIRECGITIGVIGGGKKGDTADRWAEHINKNDKGFTRSVFKDEETMKKAMVKDQRDKEAYEKRGGIKECDCGGCEGVTDGGFEDLGGTSSNINANHPDVVVGGVMRRKINNKEAKEPRRVYITEEQYNMLMEIGTCSVGAMGDYAANGLVLKTSDGEEDPCAKNGKIKVKMVMDK